MNPFRNLCLKGFYDLNISILIYMINEHSILYFDNNTTNLDLFLKEFHDKFSVNVTTSVDRVWDILNELEIKVFICAQQIPNISCLDLIEQVHATYPFVSNILFSEFSDKELLLDAINRNGLYKLVLRPWKEQNLFLSLQNAEERYNLVTERSRLIEDLKEQNKQLINALDDIIMLSQLNTGTYRKAEIICSLQDLKLFTERRLGDYICKYEPKEIVTQVKIENPASIIICPVDGIKAIISKLLDNACKYTLRGSVDVSFELDENHGGIWLKILVRDTGIGIAKANHEKIFEAFYQLLAQEDQLNRGNGIGLSIVMSQVNNMGGHIELDSVPGKGSTFICRIPIRIQNEP
jgi:signal transduction histidine kinase